MSAPPQDEPRAAPGEGVAIVGMACRLPGAGSPAELWRNVRDGVESIARFDDAALAAAGVARELREDPAYVPARGVVDGVELFDADFFGLTPREAELMDPQHRLFLECCWQACEVAGYDPQAFAGRIGVYGGSGFASYLMSSLLANPAWLAAMGGLQVRLFNDKDFFTTQVSYRLNLRGPSVAVQTACSTSLVALHLACQALLEGECEMALAGGATLGFPHRVGYLFQEGGIWSPDGHCRAFDAAAAGTVEGNGAGAVLVRRLEDALASGDTIHAVVRATAINNDGSGKAGYTAPSVASQSRVVAEALSLAGVSADTVGYVEAHGSGTPLGDPIEVDALARAFRASTSRRGFCALGSIKPNVGHADTAAGVASLIKTVEALRHREIPPLLHFHATNPELELAESPFYIPTRPLAWPAGATPRRAGVNSLGIGGTNAHVVLEEAPPAPAPAPSRPWQLLLLSARTAPALAQASADLLAYLAAEGAQAPAPAPPFDIAPGPAPSSDVTRAPLPDVAHTLRVGRKAFRHRLAFLCRDVEEARRVLAAADGARLLGADLGPQGAGSAAAAGPGDARRPVAFLLPGLGDHAAGTTAELYRLEPAFRAAIDRCAELALPHLGVDLRQALYPPPAAADGPELGWPPRAAAADLRRLLAEEPAGGALERTAVAHPAVFAVEYALAELWREWGIVPAALLGYSLGEYVAACLAGVLSLADAIALVAARARAIDALPAGSLLAVPLPAAEVEALLAGSAELALAAANGPALTVVGGPPEAVAALARRLAERSVACRRIVAAHAFHTPLMRPAAAELVRFAAGLELKPPRIPFVSNLTGTWIADGQATDPAYWAEHLCRPVRFAEGLETLLGGEPRLLLEVGPGQALATLARQHPARRPGQVALASLPDRRAGASEQAHLLDALGRLWLAGAAPDWEGFARHERRRRVPLPTYPFERRRYFVDPAPRAGAPAPPALERRSELDDWLYAPSWERAAAPPAAPGPPRRWLLLLDEAGVGERLAEHLEGLGHEVCRVRGVPGTGFAEAGPGRYALDPAQPLGYRELLARLKGAPPDRIVHLWSLAEPGPALVDAAVSAAEATTVAAAAQERGFYSLLALAQALGELAGVRDLHLAVVANGLFAVGTGEPLQPEKATLLGPCRVLPQELPGLTCTVVDVVFGSLGSDRALAEELLAPPSREPAVALRGSRRWVRRFRPLAWPDEAPAAALRQRGAFVIAGGLGETGVVLAEHLFHTAAARLALLVPADTPPRAEWGEWLASLDAADETARRIRRVLALEAAGCDLLALPVELSRPEPARVATAIERVRQRFGGVDGVVHAACEAGAGLLQWKSREQAAAVLAPAVAGTLALAAATRGSPLDFFVLCGSSTAATGGFGQGDTAAAAAFLDAFAQAREAAGAPFTLAIDWGLLRWQPVTVDDPALAAQLREGLAAYGIAADDFARAFARTLASRLPQVVVSPLDLPAVIAELATFGAFPSVNVAAAGHGGAGAAHPRPELSVTFEPPEGREEQAIAAVWGEAFGLDRVGRHDNFFDLGGNSLVAIQIVTRLAAESGLALSMASLLEAPTVALLARRLPAPELADGGELERLLAEIEAVGEAGAEELLARELAVPAREDPAGKGGPPG